MTYTPNAVTPPPENVPRGTLFALVVLPLGIVAWVILWSWGFIASIVAFGVAYGVARLYTIGSGGRISRGGAIRVAVITIVTLALAIFAGLVWDVILQYMQVTQSNFVDAFFSPVFWRAFNTVYTQPGAISSILPSLLISVGFAVLGCYRVIRNAFRATSAVPAAAPPMVSPYAPITPPPYAPPTDDQLNPPSTGTFAGEAPEDPKPGSGAR
jgi:hypothetical protein